MYVLDDNRDGRGYIYDSLNAKTVRLYTVGIIGLDVPISKFHHEQITMWLFYLRVE